MANPKSFKKPKEISHVVVIGTSAGGLKALVKLVSQLHDNFPAPILVVQHVSPDAIGSVMIDTLNNLGNVKCMHAETGKTLMPGHLYLAPSDHHLMVDSELKILVTKGATENRWRPAIDPLFRSAAVAFTNKVIGIILTGYLDDGTTGMKAIKRCGGICIAQDPNDAEYPDMPKNAINQVEMDYCLPLSEMGGLLYQLLAEKPGKPKVVPRDLLIEAKIAERVLSDLPAVNALGVQVPFNCPNCGGVLWKVENGLGLRFRCHTGHAYTAASLAAEQTGKIEETMWVALRMFEERKNLLSTIAKESEGSTARIARERAEMSEIHIQRIREILVSSDKATHADIPM